MRENGAKYEEAMANACRHWNGYLLCVSRSFLFSLYCLVSLPYSYSTFSKVRFDALFLLECVCAAQKDERSKVTRTAAKTLKTTRTLKEGGKT